MAREEDTSEEGRPGGGERRRQESSAATRQTGIPEGGASDAELPDGERNVDPDVDPDAATGDVAGERLGAVITSRSVLTAMVATAVTLNVQARGDQDVVAAVLLDGLLKQADDEKSRRIICASLALAVAKLGAIEHAASWANINDSQFPGAAIHRLLGCSQAKPADRP